MEPTTLPSGRVETPQQTLDRARNITQTVQSTAGKAGAQAQEQTSQQVFDVTSVETPAPTVSLPEEPATSFASDLATDVVSSVLDQTDEITEAQATQNELLSGLQGLFGEQAKSAQQEEAFAQEAGLETARGQLVDIRNKVMQKEMKFRRQIESIEQDQTLSAARKQNRIGAIEREQARELADLAIVEQASLNRFEAAQAYVDRKVKALTEQTRNKIEAMKFFYGENKEILTTAQDRQYQRMLQREQRKLDREEATYERIENEKLTILRNAQLNGAPPEILENIQTAQTIDEAMKNAGQFGRDTQALLNLEATRADIAASQASTRRANIAAALDQAELDEIQSAGNDPAEVQNALNNFQFLRGSVQKVMELSGGASPNPTAEFFRRNVGSSSTENTQLQGYVDTLRANMLTLATDPSIKQFFGPQMSDADVRLMTAAGTNLRPNEQTPEQLMEEAIRIDDFINRAETAVREGAKGNVYSGNIITAPDGTVVEIVD